ncbi:hypothetical protein BLA18110_07965 [Burkholderia lata]|nr:hypothetical protein BLA18110_07965 [Burkholderia lata]
MTLRESNSALSLVILIKDVKDRVGIVSTHLLPIGRIARKANCLIGVAGLTLDMNFRAGLEIEDGKKAT